MNPTQIDWLSYICFATMAFSSPFMDSILSGPAHPARFRAQCLPYAAGPATISDSSNREATSFDTDLTCTDILLNEFRAIPSQEEPHPGESEPRRILESHSKSMINYLFPLEA